MNLTEAETRQVLYCCAELLRQRTAGQYPGPQPWLTRLVRRLELELAVSESGHESGCGGEPLEAEHWISAREAANILGLSKRQTQRLATDLDGRLIDARWVFPLTAVNDYAEAKHDRPA